MLPSGLITFMFTDIEDSSLRWELDAVQMRKALSAHDAIVTESVGAAGGHVLKHTGDGFVAVFSSASAAAEAAVGVQQELQTGVWAHGERLKVRVGLHSDHAQPTDGDYFGPPPNRAARVMQVANGGQIAVSAATAALLDEIDVRSEGRHELRGIGAEEVFLVLDDRLEVDTRPFRLPVEPSNLPRNFTSFIGREHEVDLTMRLLDAGQPVVSFIGPGGVGKTRIALEVGLKVQTHYGGGVHFCDLAAVGEPESVAESVAKAIGARLQPGMTLAASIADYMTAHHMLVIVDNCEHVVDAVRELLEPLVGIDRVAIIATSREALALPGERVVLVSPLDTDGDGVELFVERARDRDSAFAVDQATEVVVREIVVRLDGIPLAIELAAAYTRVMSATEIRDRLEDRFRLLRGGRRGGRHETLRDTVRWSFDLLDESEAALFSRLCVFAGGFTLDAAEAVCVDSAVVEIDDVPQILMALVDKSMLLVDASGTSARFSMLETLRRFGEEKLIDADGGNDYRLRHADYLRCLAVTQNEQLFTPAESAAWLVLDSEWANLRVALDTFEAADNLDQASELVLALVWFAVFSMRFELFTWADELLQLDGIETHPQYTNLCGAAALGLYFTVDKRATAMAEKGLSNDSSDPLGLCRTALAAVYLNNVHTAEASDVLTSDWLESNPRGIGNKLWAEGFRTFHLCTHDPSPQTAHHADLVMEVARDSGSSSAMALAYWAQGQAMAMQDVEAAADLWRRGLDWARSLPDDNLVEHLLIGLILHFEIRAADLAAMLELCRSALRSAMRQHYVAGTSHLFGVIAIALVRCGDPDTGARLIGAMTANGHLPRRNALRALEDALGDELGLKMAAGRLLTISEAAQEAASALDAAVAALDGALQ